MQKTILFKLCLIAVLMLILSIPLSLIESTIQERQSYRQGAINSISEDSVSEQKIFGPVITIPYTDTYTEEVQESDTSTKLVKRQQTITRHHYVFPNDLNIQSNIETDHRYRGIHKVLIYNGTHTLTGNFELPNDNVFMRSKADSIIKIYSAYISIGLNDTRGLRNTPVMQFDGEKIEFIQGSKLISMKQGIHASLNTLDFKKDKNITFTLPISLDGIEKLSYVPIGKNSKISIQSAWPHPQFFGRFLPSPKERVINDNGFSAIWNVSSLSSNAQTQFLQLEASQESEVRNNYSIDHFGVAFIEPINIYSQSDRATKYGILFLVLTFAAFFLFETLKQLPIHPIQYALVGMALAIFFLLLISLSEHMKFMYAYLIASLACISLLGIYVSHALKSWKRGLGFASALSVLYAILFGLLQSESNALVLGSLFLFMTLAIIMLMTRKVDWYQLGKINTVNADSNSNLNSEVNVQ